MTTIKGMRDRAVLALLLGAGYAAVNSSVSTVPEFSSGTVAG